MNLHMGGSAQLENSAGPRPEADKDWWRGAVIYQIYPRSFQDTDGDGIGDLKGINQRLPYVASLGVDAIWISPFFKSPMLDFGYDVSDYKSIDPMFGTLEDFDLMISHAHQLGIRVMIDQVISHTSDHHHWFQQSRLSRENSKSDWYVWADAQPDGSPPNNWLSIFGGSAWEWNADRCQYYLHNFLKSQPDLNFHNPEVQDAVLDAARFWLDRGVDGFRLDTINFYFHSADFEDNPALNADQRNASIAPAVNPYNYQDHRFDKNQPENIGFLKRFRTLLDEYPAAAAVGEVGDAQYGLDLVSQYTSGDDKVHMCYAFDFLSNEPLSASRVRKVIEDFEENAPEGWACWAFSNHDVERHASRWDNQYDDRSAFLKMTINLLLTLRGSVCLFQGEELGLTEAEIDFDDLRDPYGIQFWPVFKGRDGCRTPMVWADDNSYGGFSVAKPWLPLPLEHAEMAVDRQENEASSLLNHYKAMLKFRTQHPSLSKGSIRFLEATDDVLMFERRDGDAAMLIAINMSERQVSARFDSSTHVQIEDDLVTGAADDNLIQLPAFGCWFATNTPNESPSGSVK